jgi:hypothetical protein
MIGVVEDIRDPLEMGRVRVRIMGKHNELLSELPLDKLPWSLCLSGVFPKVSDWVLLSTVSANDEIVVGKINSMSNTHQEENLGFYDPSASLPHKIAADLPATSRGDYMKSPAFISKEKSSPTNVPIAQKAQNDTEEEDAAAAAWSMVEVSKTNAPVYPYNDTVKESSSGHILEFDDTPGNERVSLFHGIGTYLEMHESGDQVSVVQGDGYEVVLQGKNVYIGGSCNLTIQGDSNILVKGDHTLEVEGDYNLNIKGSLNTHVNNNLNQEVAGDTNMTNDGKTTIQASRIDLN